MQLLPYVVVVDGIEYRLGKLGESHLSFFLEDGEINAILKYSKNTGLIIKPMKLPENMDEPDSRLAKRLRQLNLLLLDVNMAMQTMSPITTDSELSDMFFCDCCNPDKNKIELYDIDGLQIFIHYSGLIEIKNAKSGLSNIPYNRFANGADLPFFKTTRLPKLMPNQTYNKFADAYLVFNLLDLDTEENYIDRATKYYGRELYPNLSIESAMHIRSILQDEKVYTEGLNLVTAQDLVDSYSETDEAGIATVIQELANTFIQSTELNQYIYDLNKTFN